MSISALVAMIRNIVSTGLLTTVKLVILCGLLDMKDLKKSRDIQALLLWDLNMHSIETKLLLNIVWHDLSLINQRKFIKICE